MYPSGVNGGRHGIDRGVDATQRRLTIQQAAYYLGVSEGAVRKRVKRGTISHDKAPDGRIYIYLEEDRHGVDDGLDEGVSTESGALTYELRERIAYLERQVEEEREARRRADTIIAQLGQTNAELAQTVRELGAAPEEAAREASEEGHQRHEEPAQGTESPVEGNDNTPGGSAGQAERSSEGPEVERKPWWRRIFGG